MQWHKRYSSALAFILLSVSALVAINASAAHTAKKAALINYNSQIAACRRGNVLRVEINNRVREQATTKSILLSFILSAEKAWHTAYDTTHSPNALQTAVTYAQLASREENVTYHYVTIVNCNKVIKRP